MDTGRLGHRRSRKQATVGDIVVCIDAARTDDRGHKIQVVGTGDIFYWPEEATYLWKETK